MTVTKTRAQLQLERISDFLAEDILAASDEEILAIAAEQHPDLRAETKRIFFLVQSAMNEHGKKKLQEIKKQYKKQEQNTPSNIVRLATDKKKDIVKRLSENDKTVTLAARNGKDLSGGDLDAYLESLYELGVIDEEGNIK